MESLYCFKQDHMVGELASLTCAVVQLSLTLSAQSISVSHQTEFLHLHFVTFVLYFVSSKLSWFCRLSLFLSQLITNCDSNTFLKETSASILSSTLKTEAAVSLQSDGSPHRCGKLPYRSAVRLPLHARDSARVAADLTARWCVHPQHDVGGMLVPVMMGDQVAWCGLGSLYAVLRGCGCWQSEQGWQSVTVMGYELGCS
jgi:hypothetical protein